MMAIIESKIERKSLNGYNTNYNFIAFVGF